MPDYRVQVFNASGGWQMSRPNPGSPPPAVVGFNGPHGVAMDPSGNLVVPDTYNFRIEKFTAPNTLQWVQGMRGTKDQPYALDYPMAIAVKPGDSSIIVADTYNNAIRKYDSAGNWIWTYAGTASKALNYPQGVAVGPSGLIYIADTVDRRVVVLSDSGTAVTWAGTFGSGLKQPSGVAVDPTGNVFVSDFSANDVVEFNPSGTVTLNTFGGPTSSLLLRGPSGVAVDGSFAYVSDTNANKIAVYGATDASLFTSFGSGGAGAAQFKLPLGLTLNGGGDVFVADSGNDRISEWCVQSCA